MVPGWVEMTIWRAYTGRLRLDVRHSRNAKLGLVTSEKELIQALDYARIRNEMQVEALWLNIAFRLGLPPQAVDHQQELDPPEEIIPLLNRLSKISNLVLNY